MCLATCLPHYTSLYHVGHKPWRPQQWRPQTITATNHDHDGHNNDGHKPLPLSLLWPSWSWFVAVIAVAVMVNSVAVMVCGRHCRTPIIQCVHSWARVGMVELSIVQGQAKNSENKFVLFVTQASQIGLDVSKIGRPSTVCKPHHVCPATHHTRASCLWICWLKLGTSRIVEDRVTSIATGTATPVLDGSERCPWSLSWGWSDRSATFDVRRLSTSAQDWSPLRYWTVPMSVIHVTGTVLVIVDVTAGRRTTAALGHWSQVCSMSLVRRWRASVGHRLVAGMMSSGC